MLFAASNDGDRVQVLTPIYGEGTVIAMPSYTAPRRVLLCGIRTNPLDLMRSGRKSCWHPGRHPRQFPVRRSTRSRLYTHESLSPGNRHTVGTPDPSTTGLA